MKKAIIEGKNLKLTEEELAFYDMLYEEKEIFKHDEEIKKIAKEVVKKLGYYVKIVDWNKKETIKAKIKMAVKDILIEGTKGSMEYEKIDIIASKIYEHAQKIYAYF